MISFCIQCIQIWQGFFMSWYVCEGLLKNIPYLNFNVRKNEVKNSDFKMPQKNMTYNKSLMVQNILMYPPDRLLNRWSPRQKIYLPLLTDHIETEAETISGSPGNLTLLLTNAFVPYCFRFESEVRFNISSRNPLL